MSVYSDYKDFARSFSDPNSNREEDGYTINSLAEKIRRMEEPVRRRNNGNFSPEMLSPADRERYRNYQDLKYYGETLLESNRKYGSQTVRENNLSEDTPLHTLNYYIYPTVRQPLYREHMNDPRFAAGMYAYNGLEYKLLKEPKPEEIRAHTEALLNSPEVRNATSGIYKAVKDVAAGDMSKLKELTGREGENYAYLLGMDHFYNVINKEIDLEKLGVDKRTPPINVLSNIAAKDEFQKVCSAHAMDPLFRKGLEGLNRMTDNPYQVMEKAPETLKSPGYVQIYMGQSIMEKTLAPVSDEQIRRLSRDPAFEADSEKIAKAVDDNMKKQAMMAKMIFMTQLGGARIINRTPDNERMETEFDMPVGDLFAHGDKVLFNLPAGGDPRQRRGTFNSIIGKNRGEDGVLYRNYTTKTELITNSYGPGKKLTYEGGEAKVKFSITKAKYRMDMAVGGLGNKDPLQGNINALRNEMQMKGLIEAPEAPEHEQNAQAEDHAGGPVPTA